jgi:hypothetical protein
MHVFLFVDDPSLEVAATPVAPLPTIEDRQMSRKLALLFFAVSVSVITACSSNIVAPNRDDTEPDPDSAYCGVVVGSQTRCDTIQ